MNQHARQAEAHAAAYKAKRIHEAARAAWHDANDASMAAFWRSRSIAIAGTDEQIAAANAAYDTACAAVTTARKHMEASEQAMRDADSAAYAIDCEIFRARRAANAAL